MIPSVRTSSPNNWMQQLLSGERTGGEKGYLELVTRVRKVENKISKTISSSSRHYTLTLTAELVTRQHCLKRQLNC